MKLMRGGCGFFLRLRKIRRQTWTSIGVVYKGEVWKKKTNN